MIFESIIEDDNEIPVTVEVTHYDKVRPSDSWASPDDYYGYEEFECLVWHKGVLLDVDEGVIDRLLCEYKEILEKGDA